MSMPPIGDVVPPVPAPAPARPVQLPPAAPVVRPAPQPTGIELETLGRERLRHMIGMRLTLNAPTWNETLFASKRLAIKISAPPAGVLTAIDQLPAPPTPPGSPPDAVAAEASQLLAGLSNAKPRAIPPRSIAGGAGLKPPADKMARWLRRVFLVSAGPEAIPLLVAGGYLLPSDVALFKVVYPKGLDDQRRAAVQAAITVGTAAHRNRIDDHDLPSWLNDQLLVLMDEARPSDFFAEIYAQDAKENETKGPSPSASDQPNLIARQSAPNPAIDR